MCLRARWIGWALFAAAGGRTDGGARGGREGVAGRSPFERQVVATAADVGTPSHLRAPAHKAPAPRPAKKPHVAAPARANVARTTRPKTVQPHANPARAVASRATATTTTSARTATPTSTYTYGAGTQARRFKAHGYGRGYRNRYVGGRRGYGRSQGNNRAIVSRLRSVHTSLARLDHDYKGHRVRAMHSISMAIRQLSHRSMVYRSAGFLSPPEQRPAAHAAGTGDVEPSP